MQNLSQKEFLQKKKNPLYTFKGGWIDTRNALTCHKDGANAFYVSKSSTLPISENNSTVAHMMTIGWGEWNTCNFGGKSGILIQIRRFQVLS